MKDPSHTKYLYIETDGMVYLVQRDGRLTLPSADEELSFRTESKFELTVKEQEVLFCRPILNHHPKEWYHKDLIPGMDSVDPLARLAVNMTHPRVVVEALILRNDEVLLVKPNRGFNEGQWTLPGGFVSYGEAPEEAVLREVKEEVGVTGRVKKLLGVETFVGKNSFFTWHMFFFEVALENPMLAEFHPAADEIEEVRWFKLNEGVDVMQGIKKLRLLKYLPV